MIVYNNNEFKNTYWKIYVQARQHTTKKTQSKTYSQIWACKHKQAYTHTHTHIQLEEKTCVNRETHVDANNFPITKKTSCMINKPAHIYTQRTETHKYIQAKTHAHKCNYAIINSY